MLILLRASTVSSQEAHNSAPLRSLACGRCMQQRAHGARIRAGSLPLLGPRPQVGAAALQVAPQRRQDVARVAARRANERLVRPTKRSTAAAVCAAGCSVRCSSCMRHRPGAKVPAVVQWCSTQRPWQAHAHQQLRSCRLWSPACQSSQKIQPESSCSYMRIHAKMQTSGVACTAPPCTQTLPWLPALLSSNLHAMVYIMGDTARAPENKGICEAMAPKQVFFLPSLQSLLALALLLAVRNGECMPLKLALQLAG